jgi:cytochrome P450
MLARPGADGEIIRDLANDVPTVTILSLLGADIGKVDTFKTWSDSRAAMTWGDLSDAEQVPHAHNLVAFWQECQRLVADAHENERDSLIGDLVRAQAEGDQITDHEIASVAYSLLFAGHETTTSAISNAVRVLLDHPGQWDALAADPAKVPAAVDEILRHSGSIVAWRRRATKDSRIGGAAIAKGDEILLVLGSANRDEGQFEDGETFDIARGNARDHLTFGFGIHYCIGHALARMQVKVVLEELTRLAPGLKLRGEPASFRKNISFRAPAAVPVTWAARA